jgi:hypothetical protein
MSRILARRILGDLREIVCEQPHIEGWGWSQRKRDYFKKWGGNFSGRDSTKKWGGNLKGWCDVQTTFAFGQYLTGCNYCVHAMFVYVHTCSMLAVCVHAIFASTLHCIIVYVASSA